MDEKHDNNSFLNTTEDPTLSKDPSLTIVNDIESKSAVYINEPPNGGYRAWLAVFGGFLGNVAIWGVNYTWGVFLDYYNKSVYPGRMNELSWVGSICVAFFFIIGPINEWVTGILGFRKMLGLATIICPLGLMLASISHEIWHLYLTQGLLFGIGASFVFFPCMVAPQEWFTTKRGLAVGLSMCGSGIGGLIFSNICQAAIQHLGINWALRIEGFVCMGFLIISTILVKSPENIAERPKFNFAESWRKQKKLVTQNRQFQMMLLIGIITTFGYLTPAFYLASYATDIGLDPWIGTNLGAIMSAVNFISMLGVGFISDFTGRINGLFVCTILSGIFTLTIWTTAQNSASIWVFAVLYGFFGGGYLTLNGASLPEVAGYDNISPANGLVYFASLFGYMFGTPICSAIISSSADKGYTYAAVYCGVLMTAGGVCVWILRVMRAGWKPFVKA